ncbi:MAG: MarR family winged helix-turn-helix transcriptional regulator [Saprospiraceae bacterium]
MKKFDYTSLLTLFKSPYELILYKLRNESDQLIPEYFNDSHFLVIFLVDREFGSNQKQLADKLYITKQSIGVIVDFLIKKKYLIKIKDPVDGRATLVKLADKGWKLIEHSKSIINSITEQWNKKLGTKKIKKLIHLLLELNDNNK